VNTVQTQAICNCRVTARAVIWYASYFPNVSIFLLTALGGLPESPGTRKIPTWGSAAPPPLLPSPVSGKDHLLFLLFTKSAAPWKVPPRTLPPPLLGPWLHAVECLAAWATAKQNNTPSYGTTTIHRKTIHRTIIYRTDSSSNQQFIKRQFIERQFIEPTVYKTTIYRNTVHRNDLLTVARHYYGVVITL